MTSPGDEAWGGYLRSVTQIATLAEETAAAAAHLSAEHHAALAASTRETASRISAARTVSDDAAALQQRNAGLAARIGAREPASALDRTPTAFGSTAEAAAEVDALAASTGALDQLLSDLDYFQNGRASLDAENRSLRGHRIAQIIRLALVGAAGIVLVTQYLSFLTTIEG